MPSIRESSFEETVQKVISYLYTSGDGANRSIYYGGWDGLAASAVLRAIAEHPPPSLLKEFDKILHIDCSRWKSQRALQRAIADELKLPRQVMAIFDRQDEEEDFSGVDQGSRAALAGATRAIYQATRNLTYLVIFHNGGDSAVNLASLGVAQHEWFSSNNNSKVLWTFRGRLRFKKELTRHMVAASHLYLQSEPPPMYNTPVETLKRFELEQIKGVLLLEEAREVARYAHHEQIITPEIAAKCLLYFLKMKFHGTDDMDYNWAVHDSNYWVCDGIIQQGHLDEAWEASAALGQQMRMEDLASSRQLPTCHGEDQKHWRVVTCFITYFASSSSRVAMIKTSGPLRGNTSTYSIAYPEPEVLKGSLSPELTSYFLHVRSGFVALVPSDMFQQSERLRVLKLFGCDFSFSSPPFHYCRSLRFLGLDHCKDRSQEEEEQGRQPIMECFRSLWVLDISHTDWELDLIPGAIEQAADSVRDVHVRKGRIWRSNLAWRQLQSLRKLRVIEPTCSWETGGLDEFQGMEKLELLDLSGNTAIEVLPSLSGATALKTLVLDGCVGLEHVGQLPTSLESFSLDVGKGREAKVMRISLAGCTRLAGFILRGSFTRLEELDMSRTAVRILDLRNPVVEVPHLQRLILLACERLRSILWPRKGMQQLRMLCIDNRRGGGGEAMEEDDVIIPSNSKKLAEQCERCDADVANADARFLQSLVVARDGLPYHEMKFCWNTHKFSLNLCMSATRRKDYGHKISCNKEKLKASCTYTDIAAAAAAGNITAACNLDDSSAAQLQPLGFHVEIGHGTSTADVRSTHVMEAITFVMDRVQSLHLHDNSSITTVIPEHILLPTWGTDAAVMCGLEWCRVERCPKMDTVFIVPEVPYYLQQLETFQAADLLNVRSIWSKTRPLESGLAAPSLFGDDIEIRPSFGRLRSIHLHYCPRLVSLLPLSWTWWRSEHKPYLPSLETLHISSCYDLRQIFPVKESESYDEGELFPNLERLNLYELPKLQEICTSRILAPKLEAIALRGCWSLRRLPATGRAAVVDCEKDWWDKLEWDGMDAGHHPSLFAPRHSMYYRKPRPLRGSVLR